MSPPVRSSRASAASASRSPTPTARSASTSARIILDTPDLEGAHAALKAAGADVDEEISRMGDPVPPMFWFRDADGNRLLIVETS